MIHFSKGAAGYNFIEVSHKLQEKKIGRYGEAPISANAKK